MTNALLMVLVLSLRRAARLTVKDHGGTGRPTFVPWKGAETVATACYAAPNAAALPGQPATPAEAVP